MKEQLKRPFYYLLLIVAVFYYSCNTDEKPTDSHGTHDIVTKKITLAEFSSKKGASDKLQDILKKNNGDSTKKNIEGSNRNLYDFTIVPDDILMIQKGGYDSYTMRVIREGSTNSTENLVITRENDGKYSASLVRYLLSENDKVSLGNHSMKSIKGAKVIALDVDKIKTDGLTNRSQKYCRTWTYLICNYGDSEHIAGPKCTRIIGTWSYTYCFTTEEEYWDNSFQQPENPNDGGGGAPNPTPIEEEDPVPPVLTIPLIRDDQDTRTPCEHLNRLLEPDLNETKEMPNIKPQIEWLQGKVDEKMEYGVEIRRGIGQESGNIEYHPFQISTGSNYRINLNIGSLMMGWLHSHPINSGSLFSFEDIDFLRNGYQEATLSAKKEVFSIIVVRDKIDPTKINTYALKVNDIALLGTKVDAVLNDPAYAGMTNEDKLKAINVAQVRKYKASNNQYEKSFLQQFSGFGITLYKANADLSNWNKLELGNTGGNLAVQSTPCN